MDIFDKFNKNSSVVWRNSNGEIACPGDDCPQECDESCPIWCQTMGTSMMTMGYDDQAIAKFKKAIVLAPDFKGAWVNLATVYGNKNDHMEANKAFKMAYAIDNNYKNAIWGLITSCKNLGQFDEALEYCDEYAQKICKSEADDLREQVIQMQKSGKVSRHENAKDMALKIIDHARKIGVLGGSDRFIYIPEIMMEGKKVCVKIMRDLIDCGENGRKPMIWLAWGAFAGIGAVYHWSFDWNGMEAKGVAETLLEPRGSYAMDEYVLDAIGVSFNSADGKELHQKIHYLALWAISNFMRDDSKDNYIPIALETMEAMYIFGMYFEMKRLGMR